MHTRKIRIYPHGLQKRKCKAWCDTSRYIYNRTVDALKNPTGPISKYNLRSSLVSNVQHQWEKETPQGIRESAVFDAYTAWSNGIKKLKETGKPFDLKYRTKKANCQVIKLPIDAIKNDLRLYPSILGAYTKLRMNSHEIHNVLFKNKCLKGKIVGQILEHEVQIQKTRTNKWYLLVPIEITVRSSDNQGTPKVIAFDSGVRTFQTGYSPNGQVIKIGDGDISQMRNYLLKTDKLISKISQLRGRKKRNHNKALAHRYEKFKNLIKDCHRKTVKFIVDQYDLILLPKFDVSRMSQKSMRRINSKSVRSMYGWSHYKFREMLVNKAEERGKKVIHPSEEYTSKTCTNCGHVKDDLGGNKKYSCQKCGFRGDRDVSASRNIYLKYLGECCEVNAKR